MTRTIKLTVEYDGTHYSGFQRQKNSVSIQSAIESSLNKICQEEISIVGAGRTDAGVHALGQVCHVRTTSQRSTATLLKALNAELPRDIVVSQACEMPPDFHARYKAASRTYAYFVLNRTAPTALFRHCLLWMSHPLDVHAMDEACRILTGEKDFSSFQKSGSSRTNPKTTVMSARCFRGTGRLKVPFSHFGNDLVVFTIRAQSFLYQMVRCLMGTLLEIGKGKLSPKEMRRILEARRRDAAVAAAPAKGLFLMSVKYPRKYR